jgi:hypothetical protein
MTVAPAPLDDFLLDSIIAENIIADLGEGEEDEAPRKPTAKRRGKIAKSNAKANREKTAASYNDNETEEAPELADPSEPSVRIFKCEELHLGVFTESDLEWPPTFCQEFLGRTKCLRNSRRMQEILYLDETMNSEETLDGPLRARDLNLSYDWGSWFEGYTPCIVSTSQMWIRGRARTGERVDRILLGEEALALQGYGYEDQCPVTHALTNKQRVDLAGNAFTAESFCKVVLASLLTFDFQQAMLNSAEADDGIDDSDECGGESACDGEGGGGIDGEGGGDIESAESEEQDADDMGGSDGDLEFSPA